MNLSPLDTLKLVTSSTSALDVVVSFADEGPSPSPNTTQKTAISTATTTTICAAPAASTTRKINEVSIRNKGAASNTVTVVVNDGTAYEKYETGIGAEGHLQWTPATGWSLTTPNDLGVSNVTILQSDVANSANNTAADVTGLSFAVVSGRTYWFRAFIPYTAAATTTGSRWMVNGPANPTALSYRSSYPSTATAMTTNFATAYDIPAAANTDSLTAGNTAYIEGTITPSADGTVAMRFASEVNTSAITAKAGAILEWKRVL